MVNFLENCEKKNVNKYVKPTRKNNSRVLSILKTSLLTSKLLLAI